MPYLILITFLYSAIDIDIEEEDEEKMVEKALEQGRKRREELLKVKSAHISLFSH